MNKDKILNLNISFPQTNKHKIKNSGILIFVEKSKNNKYFFSTLFGVFIEFKY